MRRDDQQGAAEGLAGRSGWRGIVPATSGLEDRRSTEKALGDRDYLPQQALRRRLTCRVLAHEEILFAPRFSSRISGRQFFHATRPVRKPTVRRRLESVRSECGRDRFPQRRSWHRRPKCPKLCRVDQERRVVQVWPGRFETAGICVENTLWKSACLKTFARRTHNKSRS